MQMLSHGIAATIALLLVVGGVLATHHGATTRHVRDSAGTYAHTAELADHHAGHSSDIHGQRNSDADTGDCALLTAFHQPAIAALAAAVVVDAPRISHRHRSACTASAAAASDVYRLAPKTSPPATV
jgi:hypothetical protein